VKPGRRTGFLFARRVCGNSLVTFECRRVTRSAQSQRAASRKGYWRLAGSAPLSRAMPISYRR